MPALPLNLWLGRKASSLRSPSAGMESDKPVGNAKSIIVLLSMGICQGESVEITAEGPDEQEAVAELTALIESGFGED